MTDLAFTVDLQGKVAFAARFDPRLGGRGTTTLIVRSL